MTLQWSFQNPFLHRRDTTVVPPVTPAVTSVSQRQHIGRSGRSNSAPGSYRWYHHRQFSTDIALDSVEEVGALAGDLNATKETQRGEKR